MDLVTLTQAMFMLGFVAMAAGTFYFVLERGELKGDGRTSATYAALITFIAALFYWQMKDIVAFPNPGEVNLIAHTMPVRYLDWVLTTPLLLIEFGLIAGLAGAEKGLTYRLVLADIVMIVTGYFGEIGVAGSAGNYVNFVISSLAWAYIAYTLWQLKPTKGSAAVKAAVNNMKKFVIFGWLVYPIGTALQEFLELNNSDAETVKVAVCTAAIIYVIADIINKVGFGIFALKAFKKD